MVRRLLLVIATVLGTAVLVPSAPAQALPSCRAGFACLYQWWADANHTIFNGYLSIDCRGQVARFGTTSGFLVANQSQCSE